MRLLVNTRFLLPGKLEGIGLYSREVLSRLVRQHPEHTFYFAFDRPFDESFIFSDNVVPLVLTPPARHPLLFYWWFEMAIPRAYQKHQCDAFISPDGFTSLSPAISKNLLIIHDLAYLHYPLHIPVVMRWYYRRFVPKFMAAAHHVITISHTSFLDIHQHFPEAIAKTHWAHNGLRTGFEHTDEQSSISVTKNAWADGDDFILLLGALHPRKNIVRALKAFDQACSNLATPLKLLVVGRSAWQTGAIRKTFQSMEHKSAVRMTGYVEDNTLLQLLSASTALLYVSLWEGFGLPILEAMSCGVPVITSDRSSMKEVAGDAALLVDPENIDAIANGIKRLASDPLYRENLIRRGHERIKKFDWQDQVDLISLLLQAD
ncbi:MAG: glycosyltransferase family 4 protein [Saprospiraceae bacterium]|nr:glycosyltransferase family 4 protein [Saprospiraceae bacterium]